MTEAALHAANRATWPAFAESRIGPFTVRDGRGGGSRVSSATCEGAWSEADLTAAEAAMTGLGQRPLFMIRAGEEALDAALKARGYRLADPTVLYAAPLASLGPAPDLMTAFPHWPPLAIAETIWAEAGIGPARLAVMHRAPAPRTVLLGRSRDRPAGVAFAAIHEQTALLHALVVPETQRRQGAARNIVLRTAVWAAENGADRLALAVTAANEAACSLYASLGMTPVGQYHYRMK